MNQTVEHTYGLTLRAEEFLFRLVMARIEARGHCFRTPTRLSPSQVDAVHLEAYDALKEAIDIELAWLSELFDLQVSAAYTRAIEAHPTIDWPAGEVRAIYFLLYGWAQQMELAAEAYYYRIIPAIDRKIRVRFRHVLGDRQWHHAAPSLKRRFLLNVSNSQLNNQIQ